jgi:hypothetical protein
MLMLSIYFSGLSPDCPNRPDATVVYNGSSYICGRFLFSSDKYFIKTIHTAVSFFFICLEYGAQHISKSMFVFEFDTVIYLSNTRGAGEIDR